jgi:hypothetical protein
MAAIAGTLAYFAMRWARRDRHWVQDELADDEIARANWENEGGAPAPSS